MHIKCFKNDLLMALQIIFPAISMKTSLPILSNVLLQVSSQGFLNIISTDLEITIKTNINAEILKKGEITIPAKKLLDITREVVNNEIEINVNEDAKVSIISGKSKFSIMGLMAEDFPIVPEFDNKNGFFIINKEIFKDMIKKTIFAVSYDETRYVLNGIFMKVENNKIIMVSTDGRRLCYIENKLEGENNKNIEVIIPTKTINELSKLITMLDNENIEIGLKENQISFKMNKNEMISKIIDGNFPNYHQVIPKSFYISINLSKNDLLSITKRVALLTSDKNHSIKYSFWNNKLLVSAATQGVGEAEDEIEINYDKAVFDIAYNPNFVMDILKSIDTKDIVLELTTPVNPGVIKQKDNDSYICVIMPMRI